MDSSQSVAPPLKGSVIAEPEKQNSDFFIQGSCSKGIELNIKGVAFCNLESFIGVLDVFVHQARDIHNICIYQKQDVYAKLCMTSDPENTAATKIINGGGRNPVFNETIQLNVRTIDSSLKCEIWMLSRVKNYLEDQLLGFALVPLSEILMKNGRLEKEFSLSSTDIFHSPAGFVQLSLSYAGASPEVISASGIHSSAPGSAISESLPNEFDKIEFPDPKIVNEDQIMVSEYFSIPCNSLESQTSGSLVASDAKNELNTEDGLRVVESFSTAIEESLQIQKLDLPPSRVSTNGVSPPSVPASSESSEALAVSKYTYQEQVSAQKERKAVDAKDSESEFSGGVPSDSVTKPVVSVNLEAEQNVVQQDIVDMYKKSMQQFTESLAKMKLPLDIDTETSNSGNSSSDEKVQATTKNASSRVFYGSRAFF